MVQTCGAAQTNHQRDTQGSPAERVAVAAATARRSAPAPWARPPSSPPTASRCACPPRVIVGSGHVGGRGRPRVVRWPWRRSGNRHRRQYINTVVWPAAVTYFVCQEYYISRCTEYSATDSAPLPRAQLSEGRIDGESTHSAAGGRKDAARAGPIRRVELRHASRQHVRVAGGRTCLWKPPSVKTTTNCANRG